MTEGRQHDFRLSAGFIRGCKERSMACVFAIMVQARFRAMCFAVQTEMRPVLSQGADAWPKELVQRKRCNDPEADYESRSRS
jgi:hypothetical protein